MGLFGPKWKSSNEKKALEAAATINDDMTMLRIVFETPHGCVLLHTLKRMSDEMKRNVALGPEFAEQKDGLHCDLKGSSYQKFRESWQKQAIDLIEEMSELDILARAHYDSKIRDYAGKVMLKCAMEKQQQDEKNSRLAAEVLENSIPISKSTNKERLMRDCRSRDESIAVAAVDRIYELGDKELLRAVAYGIPGTTNQRHPLAAIYWGDSYAISSLYDKYSPIKSPVIISRAVSFFKTNPALVQKEFKSPEALCWILQHAPSALVDTGKLVTAPEKQLEFLSALSDEQAAALNTGIGTLDMNDSRDVAFAVALLKELSCSTKYEMLTIACTCIDILSHCEDDLSAAVTPFINFDKTHYSAMSYLAEKKNPLFQDTVIRSGKSYLIDYLVEYFPDITTADYLLSLMKKDENIYYVVKYMKKLYFSANAADLKAHIRSMPLKRYERDHDDFGGSGCHEDTPAIYFKLD